MCRPNLKGHELMIQSQSLHICRCIAMVIAVTLLHGGDGRAQDLSVDQQKAISAIEKIGAKVTLKTVDGDVATEVFLSDSLCDDLDAAFALLPDLPCCHVVTAYWASVSDKELAHLAGLHDLEVLELSIAITGQSSEITDVGLFYLRDLPQLRTLSLAKTQITDAGLIQLRSLRRLEKLDISQTMVGNDGIAHLRQLESLKTLNLSGTNINDDGLIHVGKLRSLETLSLSATPVSGTGLPHLYGLERLTDCDLTATDITDVICSKLIGLKRLKSLSLSHTRITDDACSHLVRLPNLKSLELYWTFITDEGASKIRQASPQTKVDVRTRLPDEDVAAITQLLKTKHAFKGKILGMEVLESGDVEVMTGVIRGPLDGAGATFRLRKMKNKWKVVERGSWVS